jgi:carboxylesterase
MAVLNSNEQPPEWLYWGRACEFVPRIWNLHSPEDFVQRRLAQWFHGVHTPDKKPVAVRATYDNTDHPSCYNGAVHWKTRVAAHRSMHSEAMGTVVGKLVRGEDFPHALKAAGLSAVERNDVRDHGGWPGRDRTFQMIRQLADPAPFDLGERKAATGVLFIHGFTASPAEMRPMAEAVAQAMGWRCVGPLLPGHGTRIEDLQQTNREEWVMAVERAYEALSRECDQVFVVGLSLGAVLACHLALRQTGDVKLGGLILLAPAFGVTPARALGIHIGRVVRNLRHKGTRASDYFLDNRLYSYLQIPLNRAADLIHLGREAAAKMSHLRNLPVMMFVGERESTVSLEKMLSVVKDNPWIRLVRLPQSRHILTVEPDRKMMFEASIRFMRDEK